MPVPAIVDRPPDELESCFSPRAVAVFGASRQRGKLGSEILHNLIATGFAGPIVPVHPVARELQGLPAYATLAAYADDIDLAVVVVPAPQVELVISVWRRAKAVRIITAGFSNVAPRPSARTGHRREGAARRCRIIGLIAWGPQHRSAVARTRHSRSVSTSEIIAVDAPARDAILTARRHRHLDLADQQPGRRFG
jgi:acetyltransferase